MFVRAAVVVLGAIAFSGGGVAAAITAHRVTAGAAVQVARARPAAPTASISGTVTSEGDRRPLARTRVIVRSPAIQQARVVLTDAAGAFRVDSLPAGEFVVSAMRTGYVMPHAAGGPAGGPRVQLGDGEARGGMAIALQRAAAIPGRLLDEDGGPLAGARVEALSLRSPPGQPLLAAAVTTTDDRGEFRLSGLPAGQYFVAAQDVAFANVGDASGLVRYVPTFHPGVLSAGEAQPITLAAGQEAPRVEFRLRLVRSSRVSGAIATPDKRPLLSGAVLLIPKDGTASVSIPTEDIDFRPDGRFVFRNVPPGTHQLRVRAELDARQPMWFGTFTVTAAGHDIDNLPVVLERGAIISGRIESHAGQDAQPQRSGIPALARLADARGLRVRAPMADGSSFADAVTGVVGRDSTFRIRGVMAGSHYIGIEGLPDGWAISGVWLRGRNVLDQGIDLRAGETLEDVRVAVSPRTAELTGTVHDGRGRPAADALVVTTASLPSRPSPANPRFRATRTDGDGRYQLRGLAGGRYRVAAVTGLDEFLARRPDWLARVAERSHSLELEGARAHTLDLRAFEAGAPAVPSAR